MAELSADNLFKELSEEIKKKEDLDYSISVLKEKHKPLMQLFTASAKGDDSVPIFESPEELRDYVMQNPLLKLKNIEIYSYYDEFAGETGVIEKEVSGEEKEFFYPDFDNYIYCYSEMESVKSSRYEWRSQHSVAKSLKLKNMYDEFEKRGIYIKNDIYESRNMDLEDISSFILSTIQDRKEFLCATLNIDINEFDYEKVNDLLSEILKDARKRDKLRTNIILGGLGAVGIAFIVSYIAHYSAVWTEKEAFSYLGLYGVASLASMVATGLSGRKAYNASRNITENNKIDELQLHFENVETLLSQERFADADFYIQNISNMFTSKTPIAPDNEDLKGKQFVLGIRTK